MTQRDIDPIHMNGKDLGLITLALLLIGFVYLPAGSPGMEIIPGSRTLEVGEGYEYSTIQSAVDNASSGDTIEVHTGIYHESVNITGFAQPEDNDTAPGLIVKGVGYPIINYTGNGNALYVNGDHIEISNFMIEGSGYTDVVLLYVSYSKITNLTVEGGKDKYQAGMRVFGSHNGIEGCEVYDSGIGFLIDDNSLVGTPATNTLTFCKAHDNIISGMRFISNEDARAIFCDSYDNERGFDVMTTNASLFACRSYDNSKTGFFSIFKSLYMEHCTAESNGIGLDARAGSFFVRTSVIANNTDHGVYGSDNDRIEIYQSQFNQNGADGIFLTGGDGNYEIKDNLFFNNSGFGLMISGYHGSSIFARAPYVFGNDFIANQNSTAQAFSSMSCYWYDLPEQRGNYWYDHTSPDNDSDGIVDIPLDIPGNKSRYTDLYPMAHRQTDYDLPGEGGSSETDQSPQILPLPVNVTVGEYYTATLKAYDPDTPTNKLTWSMDTNATWLTLNGNTIYGTPTKAGRYDLSLTVTDGTSYDYEKFTIFVREDPNAGKNHPPVITTTEIPTKVKAGDEYKVTFAATDYDGDALTWTLNTNASFLSISGPVLSGTPGENDEGTYSVKMTVSDGEDTDYVQYKIEVFKEIKPTIKDPIGIVISYTDKGAPVFSLEDLSGGNLTISNIEWYVDGKLKGNGTELNISLLEGKHKITLKVTDADGNVYEVVKEIGSSDDDPILGGLLPYLLAGLIFLVVLGIVGTIFVLKAKRSRAESRIWDTRARMNETPPAVDLSLVRSGSIDGPIPSSIDLTYESLIDEAYGSIAMKSGIEYVDE
jgi:hypothetical protein